MLQCARYAPLVHQQTENLPPDHCFYLADLVTPYLYDLCCTTLSALGHLSLRFTEWGMLIVLFACSITRHAFSLVGLPLVCSPVSTLNLVVFSHASIGSTPE